MVFVKLIVSQSAETEANVKNLKSNTNRNHYSTLWGVAVMQITQEDIDKYIKAQTLKSYRCPISGVLYGQTKYGLYRWKLSRLPMSKYLEIADNEEKYLKNIKKS